MMTTKNCHNSRFTFETIRNDGDAEYRYSALANFSIVGGFCHDTTCLVIAKSIKLQGVYTIIMFFNHLYIGCNTNTNMNSVRRDVYEKKLIFK